MSNVNRYGITSYIFGFNDVNDPHIPGFVPRMGEFRAEPEVIASGTNQQGHIIAMAISRPATRKVTAQFSGYATAQFAPASPGTTFGFLGRTFFIRQMGDNVRKGDFNELTFEADSYSSLASGSTTSFGELDYYGPSGFIENLGTLVTDIFGLQTCETTTKYSQNTSVNTVPSLFDVHPVFPWLHLEQQKVEWTPGFVMVTGRYAGVTGGTSTPIYELSIGVGEEPIETHPKFETEIAGTPSAPLNGAFFSDPSTGELSTDDSLGVFEKFINHFGNGQNPFAGISSYLNASNITWRERYVTNVRPVNLTSAGFIDAPHGPAPHINRDLWLSMGTTYEQRGLVYTVCNEWRAFGNQVDRQAPAIDIIYNP